MKPKPRSPQIQTVCELLGLAVIGFVLWLVAIGWLPVSSASAAPDRPRHDDPQKRLARMHNQLNLTDDQTDRIRPMLEDLAARRQALFENDQDLDRRPKRMKMQRLRKETDAGPAAVLT